MHSGVHSGSSQVSTWAVSDRRLLQWMLFTCTSGICLLALFFFARRWSGALTQPLAPVPILAIATICVLAGVLIRNLATGWCVNGPHAAQLAWWTMIVPGAAVCLFLAALSLPGTANMPFWLMWSLVVAGEFASARAIWKTCCSGDASDRKDGPARVSTTIPVAINVSSPATPFPLLDGHVSQNCIRLTQVDGIEVIQGWMKDEFEPGQRLAHVHASFCPPFLGNPEVKVYLQGDVPAQVSVAQAFPYGVRFDVRRRGDTTQCLPFAIQFMGKYGPS